MDGAYVTAAASGIQIEQLVRRELAVYERIDEIRLRVQADYCTKVAWAEWTQAEKDRAMLLSILDDLLNRATHNTRE